MVEAKGIECLFTCPKPIQHSCRFVGGTVYLHGSPIRTLAEALLQLFRPHVPVGNSGFRVQGRTATVGWRTDVQATAYYGLGLKG